MKEKKTGETQLRHADERLAIHIPVSCAETDCVLTEHGQVSNNDVAVRKMPPDGTAY